MMKILYLLPIILLFSESCTPPVPKPETKKKIIEDINPFNQVDFNHSLKSTMDIWEFLKKNPSENEVLDVFGIPDSSWVDEYDEFKILYYYIPEYQDYNFIEIDLKSGAVSGFEWD